MVARGRLLSVIEGVFAVGYVNRTALSTLWSTHLATNAAVSHRPACVAFGALDDPFPLHVTTTCEGRDRNGIRVHRAAELEIVDVDGLPVVTPARALRGVAATEPRWVLDRAVNEMHVLGLYDHEAVLAECGPGRAGSRQLRLAIERCREPVIYRSEFERVFHALVRAARLPPPLVNARHLGFELDFFWPAYGIAVEVDGLRFHDAPRAKAHDPVKHNALSLAGVLVLRYRWHRVRRERPAVIAELVSAFPGLGNRLR